MAIAIPRRFTWTAILLLPLSWGVVVLLYADGILRSRLSSQVFWVSACLFAISVVLLIPLGIRWDRGSPRRTQRLRFAARLAAGIALVLVATSLVLHLILDHGPTTGRYSDWDLGLLVFGWHHTYFLHNAAASLLVLWLVARHAEWTSISSPDTVQQSRRDRLRNLRSAGQLSAVVLLGAFLLTGWLLRTRYASLYSWDNVSTTPERMVVTEVESLARTAPASQPCSLHREFWLHQGDWIEWVESAGAATTCRYGIDWVGAPDSEECLLELPATGLAATCRYSAHRVGSPDDRECLLEFPVATASGLEAVSVASQFARTYYRNQFGANGLRQYSSTTDDRFLLLLDSRWCDWSAVVSGIRVVP